MNSRFQIPDSKSRIPDYSKFQIQHVHAGFGIWNLEFGIQLCSFGSSRRVTSSNVSGVRPSNGAWRCGHQCLERLIYQAAEIGHFDSEK
jgi:hypothetical protein